MLAKLADIKTAMGIGDSSQDAMLTLCLKWAQALIERHCGRWFEVASGIIEYHDGGNWDLYLHRFPVVGAFTGLVVATDYVWAAGQTYTEGSDYHVNLERGIVTRLPDGARWPAWPGGIRTTHSGGYVDPVTSPLPSGYAYVPDHVQAACLLEAVDIYKRRDEPGYKIVASMPEQMSGGSAPPIDLLPIAKEMLRGEHR